MNPNSNEIEPAKHAAAEDAHAVPRQTTPAWEWELLLSIGLVVGLLQLPGALDSRFDPALARASELWLMLLVYVYIYAKVAIYGLVGTFIVHLLTRGFWVALLGLRSVFPHGVRWDQLDRTGPIGLELARRESEPLPVLIERVDNFGSGTFAFGFILLSTSVTFGVVTVATVAAVTLIVQFLLPGRQFEVLIVLITLIMVPPALAQLVDRRLSARLQPGGRAWRLIELVLEVSRRLFGTRIHREMLLVFSSNVGQRRTGWLLAGAFYVLIGGASFDLMARRNIIEPFGSSFVPRGGAAVLEPANYADQRGSEWRYSMLPFVQSDVIEDDPYLRLFVPVSPRRFPAAVRSDCPDVALERDAEPAGEAVRRRAVLDCLGRLLDVRLDGTALPTTMFEFSDDPASSLPGLVAYIPLAGAAAGRHELTVRKIRSRDDEPKPGPDEPVQIPFWR